MSGHTSPTPAHDSVDAAAPDPVPEVLIVSYRRADLLAACLTSVAEHLPEAQVRVWDNLSEGSADVAELASAWPQVEWTFAAENVGFAAAVNGLMRRVEAPSAFLLNPDALLLGGLSGCRRTLATDPTVAAVAPNVVEPGHHPWDNAHREPTWIRHLVSYSGYEDRISRFAPLSLTYRHRPIDVDGYLTGAGLLISMAAWRSVGEFDERYFLYGEEADWCHRARRRGLRLVSIDEPGIEHTAAGTVSDVSAGRTRSHMLLDQSRVRYIRDQEGRLAARAYRSGAAVLERVQRSKRGLGGPAETTAPETSRPDFIITTPTLGVGGAERQRVALANGLAAAGERVQLRALQSYGPLLPQLIPDVQRRRAPFATVESEAGERTLLVTGTSNIEIAFGLAWRARNPRRGRWVIANHHGAEESRPVFATPVAATMLAADGMIYLSQVHRRDHARHQRLDTGRWWVVPNGIDIPADPPARPPHDGPLRLVTASRLDELKQIDLLVRALGSGLDDVDLTLDIWGEGPDRARIETVVESSGQGRVRLRGWCDDMPAMLATADVLCLPSRTEAQPISVLEAMAAGTCVAAHPVAAVPEMLADGALGYLVDPPTEEGWRVTLRAIAQDPQGVAVRVAEAATRVRELYSAEAMVRGYQSVRDDVFAGGILRRGVGKRAGAGSR